MNRGHPQRSLGSKIVEEVLLAALVIFCMPCWIYYMASANPRRPRFRKKVKPPRPRPLPKKRIDIHGRRPVEQPQTCHLFRLPPELRQHIYERTLGGYMVKLRYISADAGRRYVGSSCCMLADFPGEKEVFRLFYDPPYIRDTSATVFSQKVPVALLRTCRQIYQEARPILHQRNTFHFMLQEFPALLFAGLGKYTLPDLRRIHLIDVPDSYRDAPSWEVACPLLRNMRLDHLTCVHLDMDHLPGLDDPFSREFLTIRNLRSFDILWADPSWLDPLHPHQDTVPALEARENIKQAFRELMIGPDADARYQAHLREESTASSSENKTGKAESG
ncbi:hypothetical protein C8R43DRAFT_991481 [Mycena crocata]|nr:hypothetical protein C8R43DRAFT_991481 [Mycena crocata]